MLKKRSICSIGIFLKNSIKKSDLKEEEEKTSQNTQQKDKQSVTDKVIS